MGTWRNYDRSIFGRKNNKFEGVEQGFDPHAEPNGRVQYSLDVDYTTQTLLKRSGYDIIKSYNYESILNIFDIPFADVGHNIAIQTGNGNVYVINDIEG